MAIKIALAGNPNSGKTTMFNALTGSNQYVGNWPGVTVEKKEGRLKANQNVILQDLPGIYSLSPYTLEEVVTRDYLVKERPNAIINIVDASNIERNLYLTTQLIELGIPVVIALNMMDIVKKNGDIIDMKKLSAELNCPVVETAASVNKGVIEAADSAIEAANQKGKNPPHVFGGALEHALAHIEDVIKDRVSQDSLRFFAIKLFERDKKVMAELNLSAHMAEIIEKAIHDCEHELDDDSESIVTNERYNYIERVVKLAVKKAKTGRSTISDKIDGIVTHRVFALPIFALVMFFIYFVVISFVGGALTDWTKDVLFGQYIQGGLADLFEATNVNPVLSSLIVDGIVAGVGSVLSFAPQMFVLFFMLAVLEECGYMSRIAFIMDRLFRRFGLSGKSFIPLLIGMGCSVPGIMASRTIESEQDRRMTVITTSFIPCGAKVPIIGLLAAALFDNAWWVAGIAYFTGIAAVVLSGIILKKTKLFAGEPTPFVMELPPYHVPRMSSLLRSTWDRGWSFVKKAGTIILLSSIVIWFLSGFGFTNGVFGQVASMDESILATIGSMVAPIFAPLGFGFWEAAVATAMGWIAKEEVVSVFGIFYSAEVGGLAAVAAAFTGIGGIAFMIFNLLCMPCFAAVSAIKQEMNSPKWTWFAIGYQMGFAYLISLIVFQLGQFLGGGGFNLGTAAGFLGLLLLIFLIVRPKYKEKPGLNNGGR